MWGWALSSMGDVAGALSKSLEALKYAEKTDSDWAKGMAYATITTYATMLGNLKLAEEYFTKLSNLPPPIQFNPLVNKPITKAVFYAGQGRFKEAKEIFNHIFQRPGFPLLGFYAINKNCYAWVLEKEGNLEEAELQKREAKKIYQDIYKRYEHVNVCQRTSKHYGAHSR